jgi:hypothetical protein
LNGRFAESSVFPESHDLVVTEIVMTKAQSTAPLILIPLPPSIHRLLGSVRSSVRWKSALVGLCSLITFAGLVFWITSGIDSGWFAIQKLELPVGLRAISLSLLLPVIGWLFISRVLYPLLRRLPDRELAVLIERRFPAFQDRLITSVETAEGIPDDGPLVREMLQRTRAEADSLASETSGEQLFDSTILKRHAVVSGLLIVSAAAAEFFHPGTAGRWWNAFVRCEAVYHVRTTALQVTVIAQPGDRRCSFQESPEEFKYLHPRGSDLELELSVPSGGPPGGPDWVVPERIRIDTIRMNGTRSRAYVSSTSPNTFRFVITRLQEPVRLELLAGDFRSPRPYVVTPVSLPDLTDIQLRCIYPEYTGWNQLRNTELRITGSEISVPVGTRFELTASSSKPLKSARISAESLEILGDRSGTEVDDRNSENPGQQAPLNTSQPLISSDGSQVRWTFEVTPEQTSATPESASSTEQTDPPPESDFLGSKIASNTVLKFSLHDADDIISPVPQSLRIDGISDKAPTIVARISGVENAVTRMARIPVEGKITDDYGLSSAGFQFIVDDESTWRPRPFRKAPAAGSTEFPLQPDSEGTGSIFEVAPLELSEGQTLTLLVTAQDGNTLTTPGISRSEPMLFRIVSAEDLLSQLYLREVTLRRRFEEVISQLEQIQTDLNVHVPRTESSGTTTTRSDQDKIAVSTTAARSGDNLRRQATELQSITEGFDNIIQQLVNNAVPPAQAAETMRTQILSPMQKVTLTQIPTADRALSDFRVAAQEDRVTRELIVRSADSVSSVIKALRQILENVRDMAEFHEAIRDLKAIYEEQQRIHEETKALQKRNLIDRLKLLQ